MIVQLTVGNSWNSKPEYIFRRSRLAAAFSIFNQLRLHNSCPTLHIRIYCGFSMLNFAKLQIPIVAVYAFTSRHTIIKHERKKSFDQQRSCKQDTSSFMLHLLSNYLHNFCSSAFLKDDVPSAAVTNGGATSSCPHNTTGSTLLPTRILVHIMKHYVHNIFLTSVNSSLKI